MLSTRYSCHILMNFKFSRRGLKIFKYQFYDTRSSGSQVVPCGETDGRREMTTLIFAFRNFANGCIKSLRNCLRLKHCLSLVLQVFGRILITNKL